MHTDHHAKLDTGHACREFTVPYYAPHRPPPSTVLSAPLLHAKGHRKQADGTARVPTYKKARQVALPQQHALTRHSLACSRFICLAYTVYSRAHEPSSTVVARRSEQPMSIPLLFPLFLWSSLCFPPCLCMCRATHEIYKSSAMTSSKHEARRKLVQVSLPFCACVYDTWVLSNNSTK
jgi:hypothetical protein